MWFPKHTSKQKFALAKQKIAARCLRSNSLPSYNFRLLVKLLFFYPLALSFLFSTQLTERLKKEMNNGKKIST